MSQYPIHQFYTFYAPKNINEMLSSQFQLISSPPKVLLPTYKYQKAFVHMVSTSPALFVPSSADARRSPLTDAVASQRGGAAYAHVEWRRN